VVLYFRLSHLRLFFSEKLSKKEWIENPLQFLPEEYTYEYNLNTQENLPVGSTNDKQGATFCNAFADSHFKGIVQRILRGARLGSLVRARILEARQFFFWILKEHHHKRSINHFQRLKD
jgi:hypothetical protein